MFKQIFAAVGVLVILGSIITLSEMDSLASEDGSYIPADVEYCAQDCPDCEDGVCPPERRFKLFGNNRRSITRNGSVNVQLFNRGADENPFEPVPQGDFTPISSDEMSEDFAEDYSQGNDVIDVDVNESQPRRRLFNRQQRQPRVKRQGFLRRFFSCIFNRNRNC